MGSGAQLDKVLEHRGSCNQSNWTANNLQVMCSGQDRPGFGINSSEKTLIFSDIGAEELQRMPAASAQDVYGSFASKA